MANLTTPSATTIQRVYHQRVRFLYQGGVRAISFNIINAVLLCSVYWFTLQPSYLVTWLILMTLVSIARMTHTSLSLEKSWEFSSDKSKLLEFRLGVFVTGVVWGTGFAIFSPELNDTYTLLFLFTLAGMSAGAFSSMASDRFTYLLYILPMLIPAISISASQGNLLSLVMTIMLILFTLMLTVSHKLAAKTFADGFEYRFEHEDLVKELVKKNDDLNSLNHELEKTQKELSRISLSDELTQIPNRRHFMRVLKLEIKRARREHTPLSAVMIDVDYFKKFNDTYGHLEGDQCLRMIATVLRETLQRSSDFLARYGGEEFVALLPNTNQDSALIVAERMRMAIFDADIEHRECALGRVTISAGIASCSAVNGCKNWQTLIELADRSLYQSKSEGRNRVSAHDQNAVVVPITPGHTSLD
ncbi:MAG: GGDEF domain-containing protein [Candidatus Thiodiazotropha lotti]|uniref:diguanylate cyclase n=1 Tax=Candidatus Thiodiazotropha lotti TaxID=2792787 RepID=A0A9E4N080_9GAMM|nr:GGDEF domain-containing protein [Candidatus Thiodiazotropha lotti]MCG7920477.1 GGDEF domain-containing protein [Candidatus Thiodiazotropha lotti]MCG7938958.1 GGDEF domain-containing protein [Candidatus Thiodiazotropha lotti]MCG7988089.1 GGDEF domain-containing protein [Candidatus Thiodiazotropha lotti]MCG8005937.1 GGDEF domain-containing protein [Candidatus Thiodiazotropha lotti]